jgi:V8-like Glu-specific endopeptidase/soluble cytochrome b562
MRPTPSPTADTTALESPFLNEALRLGEPETGPAPGAAALAAESLFQRAFAPVDEAHGPMPDEAPALHDEAPFANGETGVIDGENRVRVTPTTGVPWRWICKVAVKGNRESQPGGGTGVLVSRRHVLTAAHVVYEAAQNMQNFSIEVTPALDYGDEPLGTYVVTAKPKLPRNYQPDAANHLDFDYALLELETAVGAKTFSKLQGKALGFWGDPANGANSVFARPDPATLNGKAVLTAGYPRSSGAKKLMCAAGMLHSVNRLRRTMAMTADTTPGQSGSPIWATENGQCRLVGIAVGAGQQANFAVRVTRELVRQLRTWITEGGETPAMADTEAAAEEATEAAVESAAFTPDDAREVEGERASELWLESVDESVDESIDESVDEAVDEAADEAMANEVPPWAAAIDPFPPKPTLTFVLDDKRMTEAFAPVASGPVDPLCAAVVDLTSNPATPPYAGHRDDEMIFAGSLLKICTMYAAFALKAQVQAFVTAARGEKGAPVGGAAIARAIEAAWRPKLRAMFPRRPTRSFGNGVDVAFPKLDKIFTFAADGTVDFARAAPALTDADLDKPLSPKVSAETKSPPGRFEDWLRLTMRWSNNTAAGRCARAIGYFYLNGALARAGLFDAATQRGLWLSADYAGHDWVSSNNDRLANAAGPLLDARWATQQRRRRSNAAATASQVARFMTLLAQGKLVDADSSKAMLAMMTVTPTTIGSYANFALENAGRKPTTIAAKIGFGDDSFSHDCAIVERTVDGKALRYVAVGLGSARGRGRADLDQLFVRLDEAIVTRNA